MEAPSEENPRNLPHVNARNVEKYIQWVSTLSLAIRVYIHSFSCCCLQNLRNPAGFSKIRTDCSSTPSKVIDLCHFLLVVHWNQISISSRFRDTGPIAYWVATELAAGQLSRYHHKGPVASKFVGSKPSGLSRVGCNVGGLPQA